MSPMPTSATPRRRISGGTLLAWLFLFGLLGGMLLMPSRQNPGTQSGQEPAVAASLAAVSDDPVPPQDAQHLAVHKKRRRIELEPVAAEYASAKSTQYLALAALSTTPAVQTARAPTPRSGSSAPTSDTPQLRLRPGQAPPAV